MTRLVLLAAVAAAAAGCGDPQHPRHYPRWAVVPTAAAPEVQWRDCAGVRAFVRKSGKAGIGVTLELRSRMDCAVTIAGATLALDDGTTAAGQPPALAGLRGRSLVYLWLPVHFDGDGAWNRGARRGRLDVTLAVGGVPQPAVSVPLAVRFDGGVWGAP